MAWGNATAAWDCRPAGFLRYRDLPLTAGATGLIYAGSLCGVAIGTGTLRYAEDAATVTLLGIAADTVSSAPSNPAAGDRLRIILPGAVVVMKDITDTLDDTILGKVCYLDNGASGTPQHVEITIGTNLLGTVGKIVDYSDADDTVTVDTHWMGFVGTTNLVVEQ